MNNFLFLSYTNTNYFHFYFICANIRISYLRRYVMKQVSHAFLVFMLRLKADGFELEMGCVCGLDCVWICRAFIYFCIYSIKNKLNNFINQQLFN